MSQPEVYGWPDGYCIANAGPHEKAYMGLDGHPRCLCGAAVSQVDLEHDDGNGTPVVPKFPNAGTQNHKVLEALYEGIVCSFTFYKDPALTHRLAARIYDLRKLGWTIDNRSCQNPYHDHQARAVEYELRR